MYIQIDTPLKRNKSKSWVCSTNKCFNIITILFLYAFVKDSVKSFLSIYWYIMHTCDSWMWPYHLNVPLLSLHLHATDTPVKLSSNYLLTCNVITPRQVKKKMKFHLLLYEMGHSSCTCIMLWKWKPHLELALTYINFSCFKGINSLYEAMSMKVD